jgi:hypothetical protein
VLQGIGVFVGDSSRVLGEALLEWGMSPLNWVLTVGHGNS